MKGQSSVVGLATRTGGKPLKALVSEIRERESVTGFSLWFTVSFVLLLYVYFTLHNASGTLRPCKTLLPHFSTHEMGPLHRVVGELP